MRRSPHLGLAGALAFAPTLFAQAPRVLDKPLVELSDPFTNVGGIRELSDGRVIVVDNGDRAVYVVDFKAGTSTQIGRSGDGPREYRVPGALLPLGGDSTLLADVGNGRLLALGPDAQPTSIVTDAWPQGNNEPGTRLPRAVDAQGRGYFVGRTTGAKPVEGLSAPGSASLLRSRRGSPSEDTLGSIYMAPRRISTQMKDGKIAAVFVMIPPYSAQDGWAVFPDGAVAIVRVKDYRVEWQLPDGRRVTGQPIPFSPVRVTDRDKEIFESTQGRAAAKANLPPARDWPDFKPPFVWNEVLAGADGRLWIPRYAPASERATLYDVVDRRGVVVARAQVPNGGRVVGFGARAIYVVRKDADDLQYLQRFGL